MTEAHRVVLDAEEREIREHILEMARLVDQALWRAIASLRDADRDAARSVVDGDERVNDLERRIERECLIVLASQQPVARDLRAVLAAMHIAVELERIGDHARGIAEGVLELGRALPAGTLERLVDMAGLSAAMLSRVTGAYHDGDDARAEEVARDDDALDALEKQMIDHVLESSKAGETDMGVAARVLWMSHSLERIGDRVTNIAERVVFMVSGETKELG
jgi:phosphate transport system protein